MLYAAWYDGISTHLFLKRKAAVPPTFFLLTYCIAQQAPQLWYNAAVDLTHCTMQLSKHTERISDEGLPAVSKVKTEYIRAECISEGEEVPLNPANPRSDSAFQPNVEPLDTTSPITDEHSQRRSMQVRGCPSA